MRSLLLSTLLILSFGLFAQHSKKISECFENRDGKQLSSYFSGSIDLNLPSQNGIYQKDQATVLLDNFFTSLSTTSYEVKHEGGSKQGSKFHIGKLKSEKKHYRTYLLYNTDKGIPQIIELRIEEE